jgi:hypothetical protein
MNLRKCCLGPGKEISCRDCSKTECNWCCPEKVVVEFVFSGFTYCRSCYFARVLPKFIFVLSQIELKLCRTRNKKNHVLYTRLIREPARITKEDLVELLDKNVLELAAIIRHRP